MSGRGGTRLDTYLVESGLAPTRAKAQGMIMAGVVEVDGRVVTKAGTRLAPGSRVEIVGQANPYVSRGGLKLEGAIRYFGLDVAGMRCLDVGASTGGFTHCLLMHGACSVTALDVGYGQLDYRLRTDPRVEVIERTNARTMGPDVAPGPYELITVDVSFISLSLVIPNLLPRLASGGLLLVLVKPQFEVGRKDVGKGGVVRDQGLINQAVDKVQKVMEALGLVVLGRCRSPVKGPKGNQEVFLLARKEE